MRSRRTAPNPPSKVDIVSRGAAGHGSNGGHRGFRWLSTGLGVLLLITSLGVGLWTGRARAIDGRDTRLRANVEIQARRIHSEFLRSQAIVRILAQNPSLNEVRDGALTTSARERANTALGYLEELYPGLIGEACLIGADGRELARVVNGIAAQDAELSDDESANDFFAPTFSRDFDQVYQATPYVSHDTNQWVIANATLVPNAEREKRLIVHFEITLGSFGDSLRANGVRTRVMDAGGLVIIDTAHASSGPHGGSDHHDKALGFPDQDMFAGLVPKAGKDTLITTVGDERVAVRRVAPVDGNANDWIVMTSAPATVAITAGVGPVAAVLLLLGAALLLAAWRNERSYQATLRRMSLTDDLTGLANRVLLRDRCDHALRLAKREGTQVAILLLDLDSFKEVNDTLGHHQGDVLLQEVTARLQSVIRETDTLARLGGDEFAIIMPKVDGVDGALVSARRIYGIFEENFELADVPVHVTGSIGIAVFPEHGSTMDDLLQHADVAMYRAKSLGSRVAEYTEQDNANTERQLTLIAQLRNAVFGGQLELHYQPKFVTGTSNVVGVEALVRWQHPTLGLIPPSEFIGAAERTGLIRPLTQWVLNTGLAQQVLWCNDGIDISLAVNLSPRSLSDPHLVADVLASISAAGADPSRLLLEVTEGSFLAEPERAISVLHELRGHGIGVSIDDYGTGYSSLSYLRNLPIVEVKIDRSFVGGLEKSAADRSIVESTIRLAHSLGFVVVAEGIEDQGTLDRLASFGCDFVQGFHVGRPARAADLTPFLAERFSQSIVNP